MVRRPSIVVSPSSTIFRDLLQNRWANQSQFHMEPQWDGGKIVCSWGRGHITKMTTMPIYGKNPSKIFFSRSVRVAERLALPTSGHGVAGSNPAGGEILPEPKRRFIAQSFSCSSFHRLEVTEILLKGRKTLTHPSIFFSRTKGPVTLWLGM